MNNRYGIRNKRLLISEQEAEQVLAKMNVTEEELSALNSWLAEGGSFYNNPNDFIGENGQEMPFIEAYRDAKYLNESGYFERLAKVLDSPVPEGELPF